MGNRAVVTVEGSKVGVYLHWNGGEESVTAFLRAAKDLGVRAPIADTSYFYARFAQIIGNYFGGTTSVGIDALANLDTDNGDNGTYVIDGEFKIVQRKHCKYPGQVNAATTEGIYAEVMRVNKDIFSRE
jgi:hypothetical protein